MCAFNTFLLSLDNALSSHREGSAILLICVLFSHPHTHLSLFLWVYGIVAVNKADFIQANASHSTLNILGSTETWIRPEDSATPAALSNNFSLSHTPRQSGRGSTGLLISNNWKYSTLSSPLQLVWISCHYTYNLL